jgi:hypothetical protein
MKHAGKADQTDILLSYIATVKILYRLYTVIYNTVKVFVFELVLVFPF